MTPPYYIRYDAFLCKPGKGEYATCIARTSSKKHCENMSTTFGSLCPIHARSLCKYKKITTHKFVSVCKKCREVPVSFGKLCNECVGICCISGTCRRDPIPGSAKCASHQPRCTICKKTSHNKIGNKFFCKEHCGNCNHCNEPIEIESYRLSSLCRYCYTMKCLHSGCVNIVIEGHFCPQHIPQCEIVGCTEQMTFYFKGIVRCSTHQPHCHGCNTPVNETTIKHISICYVGTDQYRYYGLKCCNNIPKCQDCGATACYEYDERLFSAFCMIHNHMCGFPGCRQRTMPLGHYCDDHWAELEIFRILYVDFIDRKNKFNAFASFARCVGRTGIIRNELSMACLDGHKSRF